MNRGNTVILFLTDSDNYDKKKYYQAYFTYHDHLFCPDKLILHLLLSCRQFNSILFKLATPSTYWLAPFL